MSDDDLSLSLHRYRNLILQTIDVTATSIAQLFQARVCFKSMNLPSQPDAALPSQGADAALPSLPLQPEAAEKRCSSVLVQRHRPPGCLPCQGAAQGGHY